ADRGYFLSRTWRMHPALCERVSNLSYEGRLFSQLDVTTARSLDGVPPGVRTAAVEHVGNATCSAEESDEVVRQIQALLGTPWRGRAGEPAHPLGETDVLVVAPYNAQVSLIRRALTTAGLEHVE